MIEFIIIVVVFLSGLAVGSAVTIKLVSETIKPNRDAIQRMKVNLESKYVKKRNGKVEHYKSTGGGWN
tara:strand:- start:45 stop:248 length:204 start_codon:yes stop_codon:yes gene_type:complete